jgi:ubiquinone/menaquinone biosynthesis C-methylase UbiE
MSSFHETPHPMLMKAPHDELARELFNRSFTLYLEADARPRLRNVYEREVKPALMAETGHEPTRREIAKAMREITPNRWWYALRTRSQRNSYEVAVAVVDKQIPELMARAAKFRDAAGPTLTLDPSLKIPGYISALDIHHMPGGYHTERRDDDIAAGAVYDRQMTINRMGTQGDLNDDPGVTLAAWTKQQYPDLKPLRILELGCSVGHNTLPFKQTYPEAEVYGIDVGAPVLRYAHARAAALSVPVHFSQQNAEHTNFADGSFDIVFSRILLHETSRAAVPKIFAECHRLLRKGGLMFHSDAPQFNELDPYVASLRDWDITCNNEPFMDVCYDMPFEEMYAAAGFDPAACFRTRVPSQFCLASGIDPRFTRTGGSMFLVGATK